MSAARGAPRPREPRAGPGDAVAIGPAGEDDAPAIAALNNLYAPDGLTLPRTPAFVAARAESYRVARDAEGRVVGCVAVDEYAPSLAELVSLAVAPEAQGKGLGRRLIAEAERVARQRGYTELFAVSLADTLFMGMGFAQSSIAEYPEKQARYAAISRSELSIGKKFLFVKPLDAPAPRAARLTAGPACWPSSPGRRGSSARTWWRRCWPAGGACAGWRAPARPPPPTRAWSRAWPPPTTRRRSRAPGRWRTWTRSSTWPA